MYTTAHARPAMATWLVKVLAALPLTLALFVYLAPVALDYWDSGLAVDYGIPQDAMDQFRTYDTDGDGRIDPLEFFELLVQLPNSNFESTEMSASEGHQFVDEHLGAGSHVLIVQAEFAPLNRTTMTKFSREDRHHLIEGKKLLGLLQWETPAVQTMQYGAANFEVFLPPRADWPVGRVYGIIEDFGDRAGVYMHSYHPPKPQRNEQLLHALMSQFHVNSFVYTRFGPRGTQAVLRARSGDLVDIVIRSHTEFQLNELPYYPFWFTPAQFAGRLITNTSSGQILFFEMALPVEKQLNVDMEWLTGADGANEVDIGYCPMLKLHSLGVSQVWQPENVEMALEEEDISSVDWDEEISLPSAQSALEKTFYPFKEIAYHSYLDAMSLAKLNGKLVHLIMLWGALDDQSC